MGNKRNIVAIAAILLVSGIVAWWFAVDRTPGEWVRPVSLEGRYDARYELTFDGRVPGAARAAARLTVRGRLDVQPVTREDDARWFAARLAVQALERDEAATQVTDFGGDGAEERLSAAWMFRLDDEGRVAEARFAEGMPISARAMFSSIVSGAQLARPRGTDPHAWEADETELNGPYRARYAASGDTVSKTWSIRTGGPADDPTSLNTYEGEGEATFAVADAFIDRVTVSQRGSVSVGGQKRDDRARYDTAVTLARVGASAPALASSLDPDTLTPFSVAQVSPRPSSPAPGETFDSLLETARLAGDKKDWQRRVLARNDLTKVIAADDRLAPRAGTMIRAGGHSEPTELTLIEALVGAATPAAQAVVASLLGDRGLADDTRLRVLQATSLLTTPGPEVMQALDREAFAKADAIRASEAAMTLAAASMFLQAAQPGLAQATGVKLLERATAVLQPAPTGPKPAVPSTLAERVNWIGALGNAGLPESLPLLVALLKDEEATIRASAAHALRFMDPAAALPAMERAMHDDDSITVRHALLHAARTMGPELMEAFVTKTLLYDVSEHVRLGAAYAMAMWAIKAPGLRRTLTQALEREKSPKVQESLRNYLQPGRVAPPFRLVPDTGDGQ